MREPEPPAPQRHLQPIEPNRQERTIVAERPSQMWGTDATADLPLGNG